MLGIALLWLDPVLAQAPVLSSTQRSPGLGEASSFNSASGKRTRIPLGSTEIETPGIAPVVPSQNAGAATCTDFGNARSSSALFDGGGLSGGASLPCAGSKAAPSSAPPLSPVGRAGIPLGATELGKAGISQLAPVPAPLSRATE
jgi:hypothetical protein